MSDAESRSKYRLSRARVRQGHVLKRLDAPTIRLESQHGKDHGIDRMRTSRMCCANGQTAPAVDHCSVIAQGDRRNDFILHRGIAVDRLVNRRMKRDNFLNATHVVAEAVDEGGVRAKERSQCGHLVAIPRLLKFFSYFLGSLHRNYVSSRIDRRREANLARRTQRPPLR